MQGLGLAAQAGGAHGRARRQFHQRFGTKRDKGVAWILPRGHRCQHDPIRHAGGQVLHGMHGSVDAPIQQGFIQFLGEQAFAARVLQAALDTVAAGHEGLNGKGGRAQAGLFRQHAGYQAGLGQRQRRAARAETQTHFHSAPHFHSAMGGMEDRMLSTLPPVRRPKWVPRS